MFWKQWWLCMQVLLCKAHDAANHGIGKEPHRLRNTHCLRVECEDDDDGDGNNSFVEEREWLVVRSASARTAHSYPPPPTPVLKTVWRDARMLLGYAPARLRDFLWIGSAFDACNEQWLRTTAIKGVINVTTEVPNFFADQGIEYLNWVVRDQCDSTITISMLEETAKFIDKHRQSGGVFVHCFIGRSRSVAVCCYYLITRYQRTLYQAYHDVCSVRPIAQINVRFIEALQQAECNRDPLLPRIKS